MNLNKRISQTCVILVTTSALAVGTSQIANAAPVAPAANAVSVQAASATTLTPAQQELTASILAVGLGASVTIAATATTPAVVASRSVSGVYSVSVNTPSMVTANGFCTYAVASAVFALGAAVIGALAIATGGAVIAGVFISSAQLGLLAGAMGSFSAVYAIVGAYIC